MKKILTIIEPCNFINNPSGGQLTFVKNIISAFDGRQIILVGTINKNEKKIGKWTTLTIHNKEIPFFPYMYIDNNKGTPLIPNKIRSYFFLWWYKKKILKSISKNIFIQSPEVLSLFIRLQPTHKIIYCIPGGDGNALDVSRYRWLHKFAKIYDSWLSIQRSKASVILAAADKKRIDEIERKSRGKIKTDTIIQFPTRIEETIFYKYDKSEARFDININIDKILVVTVGRLNLFKGWKLMTEAFILFNKLYDSQLIFIGDGEEKTNIKNYIIKNKLDNNILLIGEQPAKAIAQYLNAADIFIMGSFQEGWSTTLVEAACCGVPCVATNFSSAKDIINDGINGYVVENRDPIIFSNRMVDALSLDRTKLPEKRMQRFTLENMKKELMSII